MGSFPTPKGYLYALAEDTGPKDSFGRGTKGQVKCNLYAIASGMAFFHLPWAFKMSSTTSRMAPWPPATVVM
jgi:hypothetical protein